MEHNEISVQELAVVRVLRGGGWMSNREITHANERAGGVCVSERTVRAKTLKLVGLGLLDQVEVFPAHKYRWSEKAEQRNKAYLIRLERAAEVFG